MQRVETPKSNRNRKERYYEYPLSCPPLRAAPSQSGLKCFQAIHIVLLPG